MSKYAIVIPHDREAVLVHCWPGDSIELETLQGLVEGYIETVRTLVRTPEEVDGVVLLVNEEGKLMNLPGNEPATELADIGGDVIAGNAVLMGAKNDMLVGVEKKTAERIMKEWGRC